MGKRRNKRKPINVEDLSDEDDTAPDPKSNDFYHDEIDNFTSNKEKILLEQGIPQLDSDEELEEEGVMDLDLSDDSGDDDEMDMDSDLDGNEERGLPSEKAWGKRKGMYYNTDYEDKDYMGFGGSDGEAAEAEEKEALAIQKRMAQTLEDADFGLSDFQVAKTVPAEAPKKITKNLSSMSKREKLQLLNLESPEFLGIVEDFKSKMNELIKIESLLPLSLDGRIPKGSGATYIQVKYHLLLTYVTNISFYMILKARHVPIENHPVVKRILEFKMLLQQLEPIDQNIQEELQELIEKVENGEEIAVSVSSNANKKLKMPRKSKKKSAVNELHSKVMEKLKENEEIVAPEPKKNKKKTKVMDFNNETEDEKKALELYNLMKDIKQGKHLNEEVDDEQDSSDDDEEENMKDGEVVEQDEDENMEGDENEGNDKRGITYQIAKNKGITPHRKKERRNPRVKHRTKFRKAKIRRKGQVREPRTEVNKYSGEGAGIRAGVRHSVKIK